MTTMTQLRKAALALPEVEEGNHFGLQAFLVKGRGFVSVTSDGHVQLRLSPEQVAKAQESVGGMPIERAGKTIGLKIPLADVNGQQLNELIRQAWQHQAPKRLAATFDAGVEAGGDLPSGIGAPATRALHRAGIRTLAQVAEHAKAELLALHGVGPKAIRVLEESLRASGKAFRG